MFLSIIFLPLFTVLILSLTSRLLGHRYTGYLTVTSMWLTAGCALWEFYLMVMSGERTSYIVLGPWIESSGLVINYGFLEDSVSLLMLVAVTVVSAIVHLFAMEYMVSDPHLSRFMLYLTLFTFFIIFLVTADNYLQLFLGWEGVGFLSYLLINFWFLRVQANKAAIKALLVNRVGDFGLFLAIIILLTFFKTCTFSELFCIIPAFGHDFLNFGAIDVGGSGFSVLSAAAFCIFVGAVGKSAQIGLHMWLPDAMEGPTPVSALIHAATMVTAGIFVTIRSSILFEYAEPVTFCILVFGAITAFFSAIMACFQTDIKKTIAYSTCSQLGYMFVACGVSYYSLSLFHLFNHAFFKALCFLSAGASIHTTQNEQDVSEIGDEEEDTLQSDVFSLASSALSGTLFLSGYFSKDFIIDVCGTDTFLGTFLYFLCFITVAITAIYTIGDDDDADEEYDYDSLGLIGEKDLFVLHEEYWEGQKQFYADTEDCGSLSTVSTGVLLCISFFTGFIFFDYFVGVGANFFNGSSYIQNNIAIIPENAVLLETVLLSIFISFIVGLVALDDWNVNLYFFRMGAVKLYLDKFVNWLVLKALQSYYYSFLILDKGLLEWIGPYGGANLILKITKTIRVVQRGFIYQYLCLLVFGLFFFFIVIWGILLFNLWI